jgi:D-alanyl-lipoteichoic acid acyltransferase DltB (MBOAT superfamily)
MARNVAYLIDVFIVGLWGGVTVYLLGGMLHLIAQKQGVDYTGVTAIWGGVTALATQIIGFHRGSSQGSADKQKFIDRIIAR